MVNKLKLTNPKLVFSRQKPLISTSIVVSSPLSQTFCLPLLVNTSNCLNFLLRLLVPGKVPGNTISLISFFSFSAPCQTINGTNMEKITIQKKVRLDYVGLLHAVHPELVSQSGVGGCACGCVGGVLGLSSRSGAPS